MSLELFNQSVSYFWNQSYVAASTSTFEAVFGESMYVYIILILVFSILVFIANQNFGLIGVAAGSLTWLLSEFGKLPDNFHIVAYFIIAVSFGFTLFLAFTDRYRP